MQPQECPVTEIGPFAKERLTTATVRASAAFHVPQYSQHAPAGVPS